MSDRYKNSECGNLQSSLQVDEDYEEVIEVVEEDASTNNVPSTCTEGSLYASNARYTVVYARNLYETKFSNSNYDQSIQTPQETRDIRTKIDSSGKTCDRGHVLPDNFSLVCKMREKQRRQYYMQREKILQAQIETRLNKRSYSQSILKRNNQKDHNEDPSNGSYTYVESLQHQTESNDSIRSSTQTPQEMDATGNKMRNKENTCNRENTQSDSAVIIRQVQRKYHDKHQEDINQRRSETRRAHQNTDSSNVPSRTIYVVHIKARSNDSSSGYNQEDQNAGLDLSSPVAERLLNKISSSDSRQSTQMPQKTDDFGTKTNNDSKTCGRERTVSNDFSLIDKLRENRRLYYQRHREQILERKKKQRQSQMETRSIEQGIQRLQEAGAIETKTDNVQNVRDQEYTVPRILNVFSLKESNNNREQCRIYYLKHREKILQAKKKAYWQKQQKLQYIAKRHDDKNQKVDPNKAPSTRAKRLRRKTISRNSGQSVRTPQETDDVGTKSGNDENSCDQRSKKPTSFSLIRKTKEKQQRYYLQNREKILQQRKEAYKLKRQKLLSTADRHSDEDQNVGPNKVSSTRARRLLKKVKPSDSSQSTQTLEKGDVAIETRSKRNLRTRSQSANSVKR